MLCKKNTTHLPCFHSVTGSDGDAPDASIYAQTFASVFDNAISRIRGLTKPHDPRFCIVPHHKISYFYANSTTSDFKSVPQKKLWSRNEPFLQAINCLSTITEAKGPGRSGSGEVILVIAPHPNHNSHPLKPPRCARGFVLVCPGDGVCWWRAW